MHYHKKWADITKALANKYSESGQHLIMVVIYEDEAVVFGQVSEATARRLSDAFVSGKRPPGAHLAVNISDDGLTYVWAFCKNRISPPPGDWCPAFMSWVAPIITREAGQSLTHGDVMYKDNRQLDHNRIELYAQLLGVAT